MGRKLMKHLNSSKFMDAPNHTHVICVRKDKVDLWVKDGYELIEEDDDVCLVGKPKA